MTDRSKVDPDSVRGRYAKFHVRRRNDIYEKHRDCDFFVLDLNHDRFARPALEAYANACAQEYPGLAADLRAAISKMPQI